MTTKFKNFDRTLCTAFAAFVMLVLPARGQAPGKQAGQTGFPSAEEANRALFSAVQNHDDRTAMKILGVNREGVFSGDEVQDNLDREQFAQKYQEMHRLGREPDGVLVLYIGAENWPFPYPLVSKNGAWYFDSRAGMNEILFRRIGENETAAIQRMEALVEAGKEKNGTAAAGEIAADDGPFHGYYFRALTSQANSKITSNFALLAYPAAYRSCGVMTFIVNQDGVVYQKDLGPNTAKLAKAITQYNPGHTWHPTE
jgi:hypothetical protein